ncbi:hypothetical protein HELRODRAFT_179436 [Helobdella robusta]|uniref:Uncharacterized protein n=1 Tax=Helobdella robusta TaxID=6412 RepID=T1FEP7_HELRO|nr:hypothetical protein HELRODRAFT_179436 [Helobdella robusta]ESN95365.1 hypothetical protein HELRODRAFT_179436 [Helobdella robusta]
MDEVDISSFNEGINNQLVHFHSEQSNFQQRLDQFSKQVDEFLLMKECQSNDDDHEQLQTLSNVAEGLSEKLLILFGMLDNLLKDVWQEREQFLEDVKADAVGLRGMRKGLFDALESMFDKSGKFLMGFIDHAEQFQRSSLKLKQQQQLHTNVMLPPSSTSSSLESNIIPELMNKLKEGYYPKFIARALVIEPMSLKDRILKVSGGKSVSFNTSLRFLGGASLGLDLANSNCFVIGRSSNSCSAHFNNIHLVNVRRPKILKADVLVTDQKFGLVFYARVVSISGRIFENIIVSLPIILISQTSQEMMARGTLTWNAAFSINNRQQYEYREQVRWKEVADIISKICNLSTGVKLKTKQQHRLAQIIFMVLIFIKFYCGDRCGFFFACCSSLIFVPFVPLVAWLKLLQTVNLDIVTAMQAVKDVTQVFLNCRENGDEEFKTIYTQAKKLCDELNVEMVIPRTRKFSKNGCNVIFQDPENYFRISIFNFFLDDLVASLKDRFLQHDTLITSLHFILPEKCDVLYNYEECLNE